MREIDLVYNDLTKTYILRYNPHSVDSGVFLNTPNDIVRYFNNDKIGRTLRERKNLNIVFKSFKDDDAKNLEEKLEKEVKFKRVYYSKEQPIKQSVN
jgi:hypothetical protein